jgi:hypothetical protein
VHERGGLQIGQAAASVQAGVGDAFEVGIDLRERACGSAGSGKSRDIRCRREIDRVGHGGRAVFGGSIEGGARRIVTQPGAAIPKVWVSRTVTWRSQTG